MKKYEFTGEERKIGEVVTLHRIRAIRDFRGVKAGDLGGWIEKEENLSREGDCWVFDNAVVRGNAIVHGNAKVFDNAVVFENAMVHDDAVVCDDAVVFGNANVGGDAMVYQNAMVCDNAIIRGHAIIHGNARVCEHAVISDNVIVCDNAIARGNAKVCVNAEIFSSNHILTIGLIGSRNDFTTFYRDKDGEITVSCGCFIGKIDNFLEKVTETHGDSKHALVYRAAVELAKLQIELISKKEKEE